MNEGAQSIETDRRLRLALGLICVGAIVAVLADAATASGGLAGFNDFYREAWPSYRALGQGHVVSFLDLGPAYVTSLILRAPFALIPRLWGGGSHAVYFASALPCLLASPALGGWLLSSAQARDRWPNPLWLALICSLNPIIVLAIFLGHPEEVLGATLCVAAVLAATRDRPGWCAVFLSLAVINKTWALVAVPVAVAVLPSHRIRALLVTAAASGAVLIPVTLIRTSQAAGSTSFVAGTGIGTIFTPPQLLWWFGRHSWIAPHARLLIVLVSFVLGALYWWRGRRLRATPAGLARMGELGVERPLRLLALVLLIRAAFDPWDNAYYHLPFLFALLAYEAYTRRWPRLTLGYSLLLMLVVPVNGLVHLPLNVQAAAYAALSLPMMAWLAAGAFAVDTRSPHAPGWLRRPVRARVREDRRTSELTGAEPLG